MKIIFSLVVLFVVLFSCANAADSDSGAVRVLTEKNFKETIENNQFVLVEYYAPWCGHCKALEPEYAAAAEALKGTPVVLAKVDCTEETKLAEEAGVGGYPTLYFYKNGTKVEYNGGRTQKTIINWISKKTNPAVTVVKSQEDLDALLAKDYVVFGAYDDDKHEIHSEFEKLSSEPAFGEVVFAAIHDAALRAKAAIENLPGIRFFRQEQHGGSESFTGKTEGLSDWLRARALPAFGQIDGDSFQRYSVYGKPLFLIFVDPSEKEIFESLKKAILPLAKENLGTATFGWADGIQFREQAKRMGTNGNTPGLTRIDFQDNKNIAFDPKLDYTEENLRNFVEGTASGKIKFTPKSQPVPTSQEGPVQVIVGSNLYETIMQPKDVFVEYYAPWCGHCKALAPKYDELAEKFKGVDTVVIAKIDAEANDVRDVAKVEGFPTLIFYPARNKLNPVTFNGDREVADMTKFIKEKASLPVNL